MFAFVDPGHDQLDFRSEDRFERAPDRMKRKSKRKKLCDHRRDVPCRDQCVAGWADKSRTRALRKMYEWVRPRPPHVPLGGKSGPLKKRPLLFAPDDHEEAHRAEHRDL